MTDFPTKSQDLAAELAPGLLLEGDANDSSPEPDEDDPAFEPEEEESIPDAVNHSPTTCLAAAPSTSSQPADSSHGVPEQAANAPSRVPATAIPIVSVAGNATQSFVPCAGQPAAAAAAAKQSGEKSGQNMLAPGEST